MSPNPPNPPSRRTLLKNVGGLSLGVAVASGSLLAATSPARAEPAARPLPSPDHAGLRLVAHNEDDPRMWYYRFETDEVAWDPAINVLVPRGYRDDGRTYPVLYLLHGGGPGQDFISWDKTGIRELSEDKQIIIVMPDGGPCGWYSNPVTSNVGPRNWETFHMSQVLPWVDANFRTFAEFDGRAVAGFSMGGFGALKYAAKYYGHFASVSSYSGPASMRRDFGLVTHWANFTSGAFELGGGTVYGVPWDEGRVSADNPVENVERYRGKRVFMVAGDSPDPFDLFDRMNEEQVLAGQREFRALLDGAGIPHESHEVGGGHFVRPELVRADLDGMIGRLRSAG
ncbi:alpha/beta hydrolase [Nocardiopsis alba]|uniref:alpha/beta hydrolase n=1 Tax=Nocardiopsis alba TaxID=53437 RepID=UPI0035D78938